MLLANPKHATISSFGDVAKGQIKDLRVQMEKAKAQAANPRPQNEQTDGGETSTVVVPMPMRNVRAVPVERGFVG